MRMTFRFIFFGLVLMIFTMQTSSFAEQNRLLFGVKFSPFRFYGWQADQPLLSGSESLNSYIGLYVWKETYFLVGADFASVSITQKESFFDQENESESLTRVFIPHIGVKHLFGRKKQKEVLPFLYGNVFKSLSSIKESGVSQNFSEALSSPWGLSIAFGAEGYLHDQFAIGAEVGLRYLFGKARQKELNTAKEERYSLGFLYTAFILQFSFFHR